MRFVATATAWWQSFARPYQTRGTGASCPTRRTALTAGDAGACSPGAVGAYWDGTWPPRAAARPAWQSPRNDGAYVALEEHIGVRRIVRAHGDVGVISYSLRIVGPSGTVPVLIDVAGAATASATTGASFTVESRWNLLDAVTSLAGDDIRSGQLSGRFNQSFGHTVSLMLATNHVYSISMVADAAGAAPTLRAALSPPYPNPFNPRTALELSLPVAGRVSVGLYDTRGRLVDVIADQTFPAGLQTLTWTGTDRTGQPVGSGVYVTLLLVDGREQPDGRHRLVLVR